MQKPEASARRVVKGAGGGKCLHQTHVTCAEYLTWSLLVCICSKYPAMSSSMNSVNKMCPRTRFPLKKEGWQYPDICHVAFIQATLNAGRVGMRMWGPAGPSAILT